MNIITDLSLLSSNILKTELLQNTLMCELDRNVFFYAYNPFMRFGIANLDVNMDDLGEPTSELFTLLDKLANRDVTGNAARVLLDSHAEANGDLIKLICNKDLCCGVAASIINKAIPKLIPVFKVQLAKEVPLTTLNYPMLAQLKYDGVRVIMTYNDGKAEFRTRNGKIINVPGLVNIFEGRQFEHNFVLDGEFTLATGKSYERTSVSGMINSALHGGTLDYTKVVFNVFDYLAIEDFYTQSCDVNYKDRLILASELVKQFNTPCISLVRSQIVKSVEQANDYYAKVSGEGFEGIILKREDHLYTFKRSKDWVKVKAIKTADLIVKEFKEGTGKYEGMIGALICEGTVEDKVVKVNVGSGLTDSDRTLSSNIQHGSIIEIKYNEVIPNAAKDGYTLFLPRFVCVRHDK